MCLGIRTERHYHHHCCFGYAARGVSGIKRVGCTLFTLSIDSGAALGCGRGLGTICVIAKIFGGRAWRAAQHTRAHSHRRCCKCARISNHMLQQFSPKCPTFPT